MPTRRSSISRELQLRVHAQGAELPSSIATTRMTAIVKDLGLDRRGELQPPGGIGRLEPFADQRFELRIVRPAEPGPSAPQGRKAARSLSRSRPRQEAAAFPREAAVSLIILSC